MKWRRRRRDIPSEFGAGVTKHWIHIHTVGRLQKILCWVYDDKISHFRLKSKPVTSRVIRVVLRYKQG